MPIFIPLLIFFGTCACTGGVCYCGKKLHDAYKEGQKTKRQRLGLKEKEIENARKDNEKAYKEKEDKDKRLEEINNRSKQRDQEIKKIQEKLENPNISPEEKQKLQVQLALLMSQQDDDKKEKESILKEIKSLNERIKSNNQTISNSSSDKDDRHWIWNFLTLENIVIMGACYALYQILKEEKR